MKTDIHPQYFASAEIRCSCGNILSAGSTKEKLRTELCSKCHPFYTGQQKLVDTAGMVDKFEARRKAAELHKQAKIEHDRQKKIKKQQPEEIKRVKTKKKVLVKKEPVKKTVVKKPMKVKKKK